MGTRRLMMVGRYALAVCLLLGLTGCPCLTGPVFFRDAALESAIRASLHKPFGCLSQDDLLKVTEVQASGLNIRYLDGIEYLTNLTILNLQNNYVTSITPLTNLTNLTFLDLGFNQITNIDALAGLFFLDELYIDGNDIFDLSPLVANTVNGGLGDGDLVALPDSILDSSTGEPQDIYVDAINTLLNAGVNVMYEVGTDTGQ